jgi:ATP-dependent protease ClpP protease subunit
MNFPIIKNIAEYDATIAIHGEIGYEISGAMFFEAMKYLEEKGIKNLKLSINSVGGSVFDGYSIVTALMDTKMNVTTSIDGIAASMAGIIALCGKKRVAKDYAVWMCHNPSFGNNYNSPSEQIILDKIKSSLVTICSANGLNAENVAQMMTRETWMDSSEMLANGIIDKIEHTGINKPKTKEAKALFTIYNNLLTPKKMNKLINHFKLEESSSEEVILNAIQLQETESKTALEKLKAEKLEVENKLKKVEDKLNAIEAEKAKVKKEEALKAVENAIKEGKIKEEAKAEFEAIAVNSLESFNNILKGIIATPVKITDKIEAVKADDRSNWTIRDYEKKDPKALAEIEANEPERFKTMYNQFYNKK